MTGATVRAIGFLAVASLVSSGLAAAGQEQSLKGANLPLATIQFQTSYDTNVAASSTALASLRGLRPEDFRLAPSLVLNYFHQMGIQSFYLQGNGGYDFYQRNSILNRERIGIDAGTQLQAGDCLGTLSENYARRQSDLEDLSLITTTNTQEDSSTALSATCNQAGRLVPTVSASQSSSSNSALTRKSVDNRSLSVQGNLLYHNNMLGEISLLGQYVNAVYPNRIFFGSQKDGYKLYGGGIKLSHHFGESFVFTGSASETSLRSDGGLGINFEGLTYEANLTYQPASRWNLEVDFARRTNPSNRIDASYVVEELYEGNVNYRLTSRTRLKLGASTTARRYVGLALIPSTDLTNENVRSVFGSAKFDITSRMSAEMTVSLDHRTSNLAIYNYDRAQIGLILSRTF